MRVYFDTEFLEHPDYPIVPISLGFVREDGTELYLEIDLPQEDWDRICAHAWLVENVVPHLTGEVVGKTEAAERIRQFVGRSPEFWAYCASYDWVVLNQLYGSMADHPNGWAYYCNDLAQYAEANGVHRRTQLPIMDGNQHNALDDARWLKLAVERVDQVRNNRLLARRL